MDILVIDGVALPTPNEYKVQLSDLDENQRQLGRIEHGGLRQGAERHRPGQYAGGLLFWRDAHRQDVRGRPHRRPEGRP